MKATAEMVDRFLRWPVPMSVCSDRCAIAQQKGRVGTNFFTADEARQMLEFVLDVHARTAPPAVERRKGQRRHEPESPMTFGKRRWAGDSRKPSNDTNSAASAGFTAALSTESVGPESAESRPAAIALPDEPASDRIVLPDEPAFPQHCTQEWWEEYAKKLRAAAEAAIGRLGALECAIANYDCSDGCANNEKLTALAREFSGKFHDYKRRAETAETALAAANAVALRWYAAASPYATPEALEEALNSRRGHTK